MLCYAIFIEKTLINGGENMNRPNMTIGIMAHVDAGKTTLAEGILYTAGVVRKKGRVDHGDAFLDTYSLEKQRGITIFAKQAVLDEFVLVDTPGHVDFTPETERVLSILDYAILVISGTDGIQGHTRTLWRLLREYDIPVFIFVNKMDQPDTDPDRLIGQLSHTFGDGFIRLDGASDNTGGDPVSDKDSAVPEITGEAAEEIAMLDESVMESYLESGKIDLNVIKRLISERKLFPCFFGSALKGDGVAGFYDALRSYTDRGLWSDAGEADTSQAHHASAKSEGSSETSEFSAVVYKISRDEKGVRLTHIRVLSGRLTPKQEIRVGLKASDDADSYEDVQKVDQLRLYSGAGFELMDEVGPGMICAVTGLKKTVPGQGLGAAADMPEPIVEPVLSYHIELPEGVSEVAFLPKLREIEEEQPELNVVLDDATGGIHVQVMGEIQTEILHELILERFGTDISFGRAQIVYKETIGRAVEGIGHFEPLRHYAEAHIGMEPLPSGSGVVIESAVGTDELDLNWQRLIATHLAEREHRGVLIGAPLTDVKFTIVGGRAHLKHTEGGDFRQATYRAVRQGLMQAECRIVEPYYDFVLEIPESQIGRAMTDIERMSGSFSQDDAGSSDAYVSTGKGERMSVLKGMAPVATMQDYGRDVMAYTGGLGSFSLSFHGYLPCHNEAEVLEKYPYDPNADEENPTGSVFCAHGAGYYVPWDDVSEKAHVQTGWKPETVEPGADTEDEYTAASDIISRMDEGLGVEEIDDILNRAGNANKRAERRSLRRAREKTVRRASLPEGPSKARKKTEKIGDYILVDGYNVIHAWKELSDLAKDDMEQARGRLMDILCNYQGYRGGDVILVFDAYRVASHPTETFDYHNIHVVFTKTAETADSYIERFSVEKADKYHITVVTSDGPVQVIIRGAGAHLMSSAEFENEVRDRVHSEYA